MDGTICNVWERNAVIFSRSCSTMIDYFGINGTITCIVTLFLAEYCGFGWVVGTFVWCFDYIFAIAWKCYILIFFAFAWKFAGGRRRPSASSDPPANFHGTSSYQQKTQAISKIDAISQKNVAIGTIAGTAQHSIKPLVKEILFRNTFKIFPSASIFQWNPFKIFSI